ncbi:MAG: DUF4129 domain-containing protein [Lachnospiraceae bacterium]|nr:DUF4129 domain-containing protein [Lachnospiraceae bacterium]
MKERKISFRMSRKVETWSALALQFILYHCLSCTALGTINGQDQPEQYLRMLLLFVPLCYLALVRTYVKKFASFLVLHVPVVFAVALLGKSLAEETVVTVCIAVMMITSIHASTTKKREQAGKMGSPHLAMIVVLLVCHYMGYYQHEPVLIQISYYELQLFLIFYLVHASLKNTSKFIQMHQDTANFPVGQMTIINRFLVVLFLAALAAGMFVFPKLHLEVIVMPVLKGLLAVLSWLFSFIKLPEASEQVEQASQKMEKVSVAGLGEAGETWGIWILIEQVLKILVAIVMVVLVVGGIAWVLYRLYKGFYSEKKENADEKEFLVDELKWFSKEWFSGFKREKEEKGTINQRIRKVYRRYVKKGFKRKEAVPETMTPDELLLFLKEKQGGLSETERVRACRIYEQARYGQPECTADELEELKRLLSRI